MLNANFLEVKMALRHGWPAELSLDDVSSLRHQKRSVKPRLGPGLKNVEAKGCLQIAAVTQVG